MKALLKILAVFLVIGIACSGCGKKQDDPPPPENDKTGKADSDPPPVDVKRSIDDSVKMAVTFLKDNQNEDGSFGKERPGVGITALAVYSIATSRQASEPDAKAVIERAVKYIVAQQREDGSINSDVRMLAIYRTSLSIMALNAVDAEKHKEVIGRAQDYLKSSQFSESLGGYTPKDWEYGGWRYAKEGDEADPDLSNVQFVISALKESGLSKDDPAFRRAILFLQRCQNRSESSDMASTGDDGGGIYAPKESKAGVVELADGTKVYKSYGSMTYALLKSYIFCGLPADDPRVQAAYKWIIENYTVDENPGLGQMGLFYYFLGMARALTAYGAETIETPDGRKHDWRAELSTKIINLQKADGSWTNPQDRWRESDPTLVCGYAITVLNHCYSR